jgi:8-oxo-dGTP pyrophosphatase MutT (NUDIX family)
MAKSKKNRGGVIPYHLEDGEIKMMFMKPSDGKYGGDDFQIAKGKIDEGESVEEGAFREAEEELGLFLPNTTNRKKVGTFLGRMTVYIVEVIDPSSDKFGDPVSETAAVKWMTGDEFQKEGRNLHKPVVKAALRAIEKNNR